MKYVCYNVLILQPNTKEFLLYFFKNSLDDSLATSPPTFIRPVDPEPYRLAYLPQAIFPAWWVHWVPPAALSSLLSPGGPPFSPFSHHTCGSLTIQVSFPSCTHLLCLLSPLGKPSYLKSLLFPLDLLSPYTFLPIFIRPSDPEPYRPADPEPHRLPDQEPYSPRIPTNQRSATPWSLMLGPHSIPTTTGTYRDQSYPNG